MPMEYSEQLDSGIVMIKALQELYGNNAISVHYLYLLNFLVLVLIEPVTSIQFRYCTY